MTCRECGAPAEVTGSKLMTGVDFDGADALFTVHTVMCPAGHRYIQLVEELTIK